MNVANAKMTFAHKKHQASASDGQIKIKRSTEKTRVTTLLLEICSGHSKKSQKSNGDNHIPRT